MYTAPHGHFYPKNGKGKTGHRCDKVINSGKCQWSKWDAHCVRFFLCTCSINSPCALALDPDAFQSCHTTWLSYLQQNSHRNNSLFHWIFSISYIWFTIFKFILFLSKYQKITKIKLLKKYFKINFLLNFFFFLLFQFFPQRVALLWVRYFFSLHIWNCCSFWNL